MFTLQDGREHLYQWDLDRYIVVNDDTICEVHFCNRTSDCSLVVEVKDGLAAIPNILLQDARPIRAYAYCDDKYTLTENQFTVKARTKPSDYVYTETEIITVETIVKRMDELEESLDTNIDRVVTDYLEEHPVEVDLSDYYNKAQTNAAIDEAIEGIEFPETDLTGYATQQFVLDKVAEIDIPEVPDVSEFIKEIPEEYVTESELAAKGYATGGYVDSKVASIVVPDVSNKADKDHVHKLSDITDYKPVNLDDYPTKQYVDNADSKHTQDIANLTYHVQNIIEPTISGKADKTHKHTMSDITDYTAPDLSGYATEKYVDDAIAGIDIPEGGDGDLSNYYTKEETDNLIDDVETNVNITDDGNGNVTLKRGEGNLPADLENYYTKEETYSKTEVDSLIENIDVPEGSSGIFVFTFNPSSADIAANGSVTVTDEMITFYNKVMSGEPVQCYWSDTSTSGGVTYDRYYPTVVTKQDNNTVSIQPREISHSANIVKLSNIRTKFDIRFSNGTYFATYYEESKYSIPTTSKVEAMISSALSGIATAEGGSY